MARTPRDYQLEYERRRIRAEARGFRSPREETQYKAAQKGREKKQTVANYRRQQTAKLARYSKAKTLKKFGVTEYRFNQMRKQNRAFSLKNGGNRPRLIYNLDVDLDTQNYSDTRVGYIVNYNLVFVNPKQNKNKRDRERYARLIEKYNLFYDMQDQDVYVSTSGKERTAA